MVSGRLIAVMMWGALLVAPASAARIEVQLGAIAGSDQVTLHPGRWDKPEAILMRVEVRRDAPAPATASDRQHLTGYAMTGDVPLGEGWRVTAGFREDGNRRLLSDAFGDDAERLSTRQYAPMMAVGYAGEAAPGLTLGGDIGMVRQGRSGRLSDTATLLNTPMDMIATAGNRDENYRPLLTVSANYRF